jgi:MYXO-CTERM domain-containing protein
MESTPMLETHFRFARAVALAAVLAVVSLVSPVNGEVIVGNAYRSVKYAQSFQYDVDGQPKQYDSADEMNTSTTSSWSLRLYDTHGDSGIGASVDGGAYADYTSYMNDHSIDIGAYSTASAYIFGGASTAHGVGDSESVASIAFRVTSPIDVYLWLWGKATNDFVFNSSPMTRIASEAYLLDLTTGQKVAFNSAELDGQEYDDSLNFRLPAGDYILYTATRTHGVLNFDADDWQQFQNYSSDTQGSAGLYYTDDPEVVSTPEPASLALWTLLGVAGIGAWRRRFR